MRMLDKILLSLAILMIGCGSGVQSDGGQTVVVVPPDGGRIPSGENELLDQELSQIAVSPSRGLPADGISEAKVSIRLFRKDGTPLSKTSVRIDASGSGNTVRQIESQTNELGEVTGFIHSTVEGRKDITVTAFLREGNAKLQKSCSVTFGTLFEEISEFSVSDSPSFVDVQDLDQDGILDIMISHTRNDGLVSLLYGKETDTSPFQSREERYLSLTRAPYRAVSHDINGDKILDLLVPTADLQGRIIIFDGQSKFKIESYLDSPGMTPRVLNLGDLNGDGIKDLIVLYSGGLIKSFLMNRSGGVRSTLEFSFPGAELGARSVENFKLSDMNDDGKLDLVTIHTYPREVAIVFGNGSGSFAEPKYITLMDRRPTSMILEDLDGDGISDVIVGTEDYSSNHGGIITLLNDGKGSIVQTKLHTVGWISDLLATDINGDGFMDVLALYEQKHEMAVLEGNGTGSLSEIQSVTVGTNPTSIAMGDLNGNGAPDIIVTCRSPFNGFNAYIIPLRN